MIFKWRDSYVKILVLFMAVLLWLYVSTEQNPIVSRSYQVPLSIENQPEGYLFTGIPEKVSVSVKSSKNISSDLQAGDFIAKIDLLNVKEGTQYVPVVLSTPLGVEVLQVRPQSIAVLVDKISQKSVALSLNLKGQSAQGRQVGTPVLSPASVIVQGPEKQLANVDTISISLDISGAQSTIKQYITVQNEFQGVTITPDKILVTVPINALPTIDLPVLVNITGTPAKGYVHGQSSIVPAKCKVTGSREVINSLSAVYTQSIDVEGVTESIEWEVKLELPQGAVLVYPEKVHVTLPILLETDEQLKTEDEESDNPPAADPERDNESGTGENQPNAPDLGNQTDDETKIDTEDEENTAVSGDLADNL